MYTNFFGLSDIPFSIAPNPQYLFMSDRHKEALAHLSHGLGDTGGFVLLTGEVGTGKTTISRCLLEQLPENTQVAFILNPTLSCLELLATICDELQVRYKKTGATLKYLTDKIQEKLLKNQSANINTILIIDEAQHLQPEVLEQLRLLTNLETNTKKLLQVILIGQPELQQLLQRRDLRQLAQRITARYHLLPLTLIEVERYIIHRVSVADCQRSLFNKQAVATIHSISQGIPRVINLLCDRALSLAYGDNQSVVNKKIVIQAAKQALGPEFQYQSWWQNRQVKAFAGTLFVIIIGGGSYWLGLQKPDIDNDVAVKVAQEPASNDNDMALAIMEDKANASKVEHKESPIETALPLKQVKSQVAEPVVVTAEEPMEITQSKSLSSIEGNDQEAGISNVDLQDEEQKIVSAEPKAPIAFDLSKVEGIPNDLLDTFQSAIEESNNELSGESRLESSDNTFEQDEPVTPLSQMPTEFKNALPSLQFDMHVYASDGGSVVKANGRDRYEGDIVASGVTLDKILPQEVILVFRGQRFSMQALTNW